MEICLSRFDPFQPPIVVHEVESLGVFERVGHDILTGILLTSCVSDVFGHVSNCIKRGRSPLLRQFKALLVGLIALLSGRPVILQMFVSKRLSRSGTG